MNLARESPPSSGTAMAGGPTSMAMEDDTSGVFLQDLAMEDDTSGVFLRDEDRLQSPSFNLQSGQGSSSGGETLSDPPGSPRRISDVDQQVGPDPLTVGPGLSTVDDNLIGLISTSPTRISDDEPQAGIGPATVDEIQPEHISESPVNEEARQGHPPIDEISRPGWRCTPQLIEDFDLFVELLLLILEFSQVMIINSTLLGWVVLGFTINSCLTKWTLLVWSTRGTSAPFPSARFFLPNGQNYIEPYAAIMQVIFSAASIKVKFPRSILVLQLLLSTAMVSSKVTMRCNRTSHAF